MTLASGNVEINEGYINNNGSVVKERIISTRKAYPSTDTVAQLVTRVSFEGWRETAGSIPAVAILRKPVNLPFPLVNFGRGHCRVVWRVRVDTVSVTIP